MRHLPVHRIPRPRPLHIEDRSRSGLHPPTPVSKQVDTRKGSRSTQHSRWRAIAFGAWTIGTSFPWFGRPRQSSVPIVQNVRSGSNMVSSIRPAPRSRRMAAIGQRGRPNQGKPWSMPVLLSIDRLRAGVSRHRCRSRAGVANRRCTRNASDSRSHQETPAIHKPRVVGIGQPSGEP